jgi:hypothetical protein
VGCPAFARDFRVRTATVTYAGQGYKAALGWIQLVRSTDGDLIAHLGGGTVEGYPEAADSVPAGFLFNGALSTYERLGFSLDRKIGKHRWVVSKIVEPSR